MPSSSLSPLQWRILTVLAKLEPPFTLTGGGALAGFHLGHRSTRDLDLFWRERAELGEMIAKVRQLDTQALIESGEDLNQGLVDAARQDGGFSPLTLAWVLRSFPLRALALAGGSTAEQIEALERFKRDLLDRLLAAGDPSNPAAGTA